MAGYMTKLQGYLYEGELTNGAAAAVENGILLVPGTSTNNGKLVAIANADTTSKFLLKEITTIYDGVTAYRFVVNKLAANYYFVENADQWARDFQDNTTRSLSLTERLRATYRNDYLEIIASGRTRVSKPWYTLPTAAQVAATWNNQVSGSIKWTIGNSGVEIGTDANYNWYAGYTTPQDPQLVWNATVSTPLFRRQATLSLKAYDILDQAKNVRVATTDNYYQETRNNTLGRYIMLSFTWRFGNFGKAGEQMRSRGNAGRMGFPMGGRGGRRPF